MDADQSLGVNGLNIEPYAAALPRDTLLVQTHLASTLLAPLAVLLFEAVPNICNLLFKEFGRFLV